MSILFHIFPSLVKFNEWRITNQIWLLFVFDQQGSVSMTHQSIFLHSQVFQYHVSCTMRKKRIDLRNMNWWRSFLNVNNRHLYFLFYGSPSPRHALPYHPSLPPSCQLLFQPASLQLYSTVILPLSYHHLTHISNATCLPPTPTSHSHSPALTLVSSTPLSLLLFSSTFSLMVFSSY